MLLVLDAGHRSNLLDIGWMLPIFELFACHSAVEIRADRSQRVCVGDGN